MYAIIIVFTNAVLGQVNVSGGLTAFPSQAACEAELPARIAYQRGVHEKDDWNVNGWCRIVRPEGAQAN